MRAVKRVAKWVGLFVASVVVTVVLLLAVSGGWPS